MKRLFIVAIAAMFAVACADKQPTVEEQMAQYQERINEALEVLDQKEISNALNTRKWFDELSEADRDLVRKACADIEIVQKEMSEWQRNLSEEDRQKLKEFGKTLIMDKEYFRKMKYVRMINQKGDRIPAPVQIKK